MQLRSSNFHFRNNLILGWQPSEAIFSVDSFTNYSSSDYNGFRPDPAAEHSFIWKSPSAGTTKDYTNERTEQKFKTLEEYSETTGHDKHSVIIDYDIFMHVTPTDLNNITKLYEAASLDFRLKPDAAAVDAGCVLPNINDNFTGKAPDLGALEIGTPVPVYGPRPLPDRHA